MANIRNFIYKLKNRINLQFIKHSFLDMKRDKAKASFAIGGIAVSIFLLTAIGMLNDTMGYNYMKMVTNTTGASDIMITRTMKTDLTFDPFFDENLITNSLQNITGVEELFPRILMLTKASSDKTTKNGSLELYGIDFLKEETNGNMGNFEIVDSEGNRTGIYYTGTPSNGECIILWKVAELLNVTKGDVIHLEYQQYTLDVTIVEVCEQNLKFMEFENALVVLNLLQAQTFLNRLGKINFIAGTILNPREVYEPSNIEVTTQRLRVIGTEIQSRLDINTYSVTMPKLLELETGEMMMMSMTMIFWFITILSMLITAILINGILSTSVEERVREFGITRVVGGKKNYAFKIVVFEGLLLGIFGSIIGLIAALASTEIIGNLFLSGITMGGFDSVNVEFFIKPGTSLLAFSIGSLVAFIVALLPALKTAKMDIIKSITPFQTQEEGWEIAKEGSMNVKSFLIGISIATIGMVIFVLLPRVFTTGNMMLIIGLFVGLLAAILIGLVFASVGIIPLIQRFFLMIVSPGIKKYSSIINISLKRYRRRNTSTVVMFSISFSFIFFITSVSQMEAENFELIFKFQYGSDLVMINQGYDEDTGVTLETLNSLKTIQGIDSASYAIHNTFDIQAAISVVFDVTEGGMGFDEDSAESQITNLFSYYSSQWNTKYSVSLADIASFNELDAGFIGVNQEFVNMIDQNLLIWMSPGSGYNVSFSQIFARNDTCIIAKSMANILGITEVGQQVRLTFYNPNVENDPGNITIFTVAGISGGIPGFWNFRSSEYSASGGGVMVSADTYAALMDVPNAGKNNMIVDKIFINLADTSEANIKATKDLLSETYKDKSFIIDDAASKINFISDMNEQQSSMMELVLLFTVIICIFGLISSMYAIMIERKFEIGILRSMGLKARNVRNMFLLESMIVMLSAGIMGTVIGSYCAYLLETNLGLLTEMPVIFSIPMDTLIRTFVLSITSGIIAMYAILYKMSKKNIMDIFRQTF